MEGRVLVFDSSVPAEVYLFRAPASYTRQDVVEFHVPGSPPLLSELLAQFVRAGARVAEPGEFTARAFLNGSLDLTRVEGVAAAISARSDAQLRASRHLLAGGLSRRMAQLREELADLLALVEAEIDFVEESIGFVTSRQAREQIARASDELTSLLAHAESAERLEVLPQVLLLGPPNAGKSTLFNRLTGTDRAIRSAVAGTTRDVLREPISLPGGEAMLCDSAGVALHGAPRMNASEPERDIVPSEAASSGGPALVDELASDATWKAVEAADLVILLFDGAATNLAHMQEVRASIAHRRVLCVANKSDLSDFVPTLIESPSRDVWGVSALNGQGIAALREEISQCLFGDSPSRASEVIALTARQHQCLVDAHDAAQRALKTIENIDDFGAVAELIALEVRAMVVALSLLLGEITTEDLLGRIFSRFCIGK